MCNISGTPIAFNKNKGGQTASLKLREKKIKYFNAEITPCSEFH